MLLLFTRRRILSVTVNEILGSCTIDWQVHLSQLIGLPHKYDGGLELVLKKASKTKLFGSASNVKQIECSPENALVSVFILLRSYFLQ